MHVRDAAGMTRLARLHVCILCMNSSLIRDKYRSKSCACVYASMAYVCHVVRVCTYMRLCYTCTYTHEQLSDCPWEEGNILPSLWFPQTPDRMCTCTYMHATCTYTYMHATYKCYMHATYMRFCLPLICIWRQIGKVVNGAFTTGSGSVLDKVCVHVHQRACGCVCSRVCMFAYESSM